MTVIYIHVIHTVAVRIAPNEHKRQITFNERVNQGVLYHRGGDDDTVNDTALQNLSNRAPFIFRFGKPEHGRIFTLAARGVNALNQEREIRVCKERTDAHRNDETKNAGAPGGESARGSVRLIVQL